MDDMDEPGQVMSHDELATSQHAISPTMPRMGPPYKRNKGRKRGRSSLDGDREAENVPYSPTSPSNMQHQHVRHPAAPPLGVDPRDREHAEYYTYSRDAGHPRDLPGRWPPAPAPSHYPPAHQPRIHPAHADAREWAPPHPPRTYEPDLRSWDAPPVPQRGVYERSWEPPPPPHEMLPGPSRGRYEWDDHRQPQRGQGSGWHGGGNNHNGRGTWPEPSYRPQAKAQWPPPGQWDRNDYRQPQQHGGYQQGPRVWGPNPQGGRPHDYRQGGGGSGGVEDLMNISQSGQKKRKRKHNGQNPNGPDVNGWKNRSQMPASDWKVPDSGYASRKKGQYPPPLQPEGFRNRQSDRTGHDRSHSRSRSPTYSRSRSRSPSAASSRDSSPDRGRHKRRSPSLHVRSVSRDSPARRRKGAKRDRSTSSVDSARSRAKSRERSWVRERHHSLSRSRSRSQSPEGNRRSSKHVHRLPGAGGPSFPPPHRVSSMHSLSSVKSDLRPKNGKNDDIPPIEVKSGLLTGVPIITATSVINSPTSLAPLALDQTNAAPTSLQLGSISTRPLEARKPPIARLKDSKSSLKTFFPDDDESEASTKPSSPLTASGGWRRIDSGRSDLPPKPAPASGLPLASTPTPETIQSTLPPRPVQPPAANGAPTSLPPIPPPPITSPASLPARPAAAMNTFIQAQGPPLVLNEQGLPPRPGQPTSSNSPSSAIPVVATTHPQSSQAAAHHIAQGHPVHPPYHQPPAQAGQVSRAEAPPTRPSKSGELYQILNQVGEGTFGKVYKARNTQTNTMVALKRIRMETERDGFPVTAMREIKLLQSLRHDNVISLYEMMVSKSAHVYMVFEYMDHDLTGILSQQQFSFSEANLKSLCHQMLSGVAYLHQKAVIHRDMKGSNILINNHGILKLADFGLARFYQKRRRLDYTNRVITLWYRPPELLLGATAYGPEVDMWSAGCIMLELYTKKPIFQGNDEIHQLDTIYRLMGTPSIEAWPGFADLPWYELVKPTEPMKNRFRSAFQKRLSPAGLDLAEGLLEYDPFKRITASEALDSPFFHTEEPPEELPVGLATLEGEWHELESKRERAKKKRKTESSAVNDSFNEAAPPANGHGQ